MKTPRIVIKPLAEIVNKKSIPTDIPATYKRAWAAARVGDRYNVIGLVDRSNDVILEEKFYNVRDENGRFAKVSSR